MHLHVKSTQLQHPILLLRQQNRMNRNPGKEIPRTWCSSAKRENLNRFHILTFSCFNYVKRKSLTSLPHATKKALEMQRSNANSIMTKTELALRARTQVRLVYETRRKRQTVVKMTKAARSVFWFLCCIPRLLFGCVSRCCRSCHRICIPPASRDRRGRHRRHSRRSSRTRFDSVPYVVHLFSRTQYLLN